MTRRLGYISRVDALTATAILAVVLLAGFAMGSLAPQRYTSSVTLLVSAQSSGTAYGDYQGTRLAQRRITSYIELATGDRIASETAARLRLSTADDVRRALSVSAPADSVLLVVEARADDPGFAQVMANTASGVLIDTVRQLEEPFGGGQPAVAVNVVNSASTPSVSSMSLSGYLLVAAVLGVLASTTFLFIRLRYSTSLRSVDRLAALLPVPVLASVPEAPRATANAVVDASDQSSYAESYRKLRAALARRLDSDDQNRGTSLLITSALPGEGKTTVSVNLGATFAAAGWRVLVVDADLRRPRIASFLGLEETVGLSTVLSRQVDVVNAVQPSTNGFDVLASGRVPQNPSELLAAGTAAEILDIALGSYDLVIVDSPPVLILADTPTLADKVDLTLFVASATMARSSRVRRAYDDLRTAQAEIFGSVLTMGAEDKIEDTSQPKQATLLSSDSLKQEHRALTQPMSRSRLDAMSPASSRQEDEK